MNEEIITFFCKAVLAGLINLIYFMFFSKIYRPKYKNKILYVGVFFLSTALMISVNLLNIPIVNLIYAFTSLNIICNTLYCVKLRSSFIYNSFLMLATVISDIVTVLIWTVIENTGYNEVLKNYELMCISNLLNIIILFLIYRVYLAILLKHKSSFVRLNEVVAVAVITVFEIFVVYHLCKLPINGLVFVIIMLGFLALNIYITYIINQVSENAKLKYELEISQRQSEMQMSHYAELDNRYEMSRKIIHDFKKHLDTLDKLRNQSDEKAYDYEAMVEREIDSLFMCFKCSNKVLSIVMSQKIALAEANNIKVTTDAQDIPLNFISDLDITALFANIWDNAIEACCKIDEENRFIEFVMKKVNGFILITVKNSFDGNVKTDNEHFLSTKNNHVGVGLSIIKSVSEKYNGLFVEEHTDSEFKIEITLPDQT